MYSFVYDGQTQEISPRLASKRGNQSTASFSHHDTTATCCHWSCRPRHDTASFRLQPHLFSHVTKTPSKTRVCFHVIPMYDAYHRVLSPPFGRVSWGVGEAPWSSSRTSSTSSSRAALQASRCCAPRSSSTWEIAGIVRDPETKHQHTQAKDKTQKQHK